MNFAADVDYILTSAAFFIDITFLPKPIKNIIVFKKKIEKKRGILYNRYGFYNMEGLYVFFQKKG